MDYILRHPLTESDIDFLNETDIEFEIIDSHGLKPDTNVFDSGWCDGSTGARIISANDRVVFRNVSPESQTYLTLRYGNLLKKLTSDIGRIYNIATT